MLRSLNIGDVKKLAMYLDVWNIDDIMSSILIQHKLQKLNKLQKATMGVPMEISSDADNVTMNVEAVQQTSFDITDFISLQYLSSGGFGLTFLATHKNTDKYILKIPHGLHTSSDTFKTLLNIITQTNIFTVQSLLAILNQYTNIDKLSEKIYEYNREIKFLREICCNCAELVRYYHLNKTQIPTIFNYAILMEYVTYPTLKKYISEYKNHITFTRINNLAVGLIKGIKFLHHRDLVHRDLKPDNIMFDGEHVKIIDLGLVCYDVPDAVNMKIEDRQFSCSGRSGTRIFLPPEYYSPEMLTSYKPADMWALGLIIYGVIFDKIPYDIHNSNTMLNINMITDINFTNLVKHAATLSDIKLQTIATSITFLLKNCLQIDPFKRIDIDKLYQFYINMQLITSDTCNY